jgi:hypothetical protein
VTESDITHAAALIAQLKALRAIEPDRVVVLSVKGTYGAGYGKDAIALSPERGASIVRNLISATTAELREMGVALPPALPS